jgi:hypothetical protein
MSELQQTEETQEPTGDRTLFARRVLVWVISFALGGIIVSLVTLFYLKTHLLATFPVSNVEVPLVPITTLPMALFFMIWLDYFMGTKIVSE